MEIDILMLVAGTVFTIFGANWLVDGASSVALRLGISKLVIGLTVVAFGTSSPELVVSVVAAINGSTEIAVGNVVGSNIFNLLVIGGVAAMVFPMTVHSNTVSKEIPLSFLAALVLLFLANDQILDNAGTSELTRSDGLVLLSFFVIFLFYSFFSSKNTETTEGEEVKQMPVWKSVLLVVLGLVGLVAGGGFMVEGATGLAQAFGISERIIGLTIVAAGTSLPELATSAVAAYKKHSDIAVGNIIGSNIFNIFLILGVSSLIAPLQFMPAANWDLMVVLLATLLFTAFVFIGKGRKINRWEGGVLGAGYVIYVVALLA